MTDETLKTPAATTEPDEPEASEDSGTATAAADDDAAQVEAPDEGQAEASADDDATAQPVAEAEAEAPAEADADMDAAGDDEEQATMEPEVQEFIGQDSTVVHHAPESDGPVPAEFRTPPGIAPGLDPGTLADRDKGPGGA